MQKFEPIVTSIITNTLVSNLPNNAEYISLCEQNQHMPSFNSFCLIVLTEKKSFERRVLVQNSPRSMLCESLKLLSQRAAAVNQSDSFLIQKAFIEKIVIPICNEEQINYYNNRLVEFNKCQKDYFLSFTSRKPNNNEDHNILHLNYKYFIKFVFNYSTDDLLSEVKRANKSNTNLIARAIHYIISQRLKGFYFPEHQGDNREVELKLTNNCESSFAFVQLIQNIIFEHEENKINYCHFEYNAIQKHIPCERRFYILAEAQRADIRTLEVLHPEYEDWYDDFCKKDPLHLPFSIQYNQRELENTKKNIENRIADAIKKIKFKLIEDVPV